MIKAAGDRLSGGVEAWQVVGEESGAAVARHASVSQLRISLRRRGFRPAGKQLDPRERTGEERWAKDGD